jgi:hypothetical protein
MRVDYRLGLDHWQSEFICFEHTGFARQKAVQWWRRRSPDPVPDNSECAVAIADAGGVAFAITMRMKDVFFDRAAVKNRMTKANRKALSKAGAFIRRRARSSLRRRKKPSPPGQPPSVHTNDRVATLKNVLFAYDPHNESLVVGPVKLNQKALLGPQLAGATVPQIQEFGARVKIREVIGSA